MRCAAPAPAALRGGHHAHPRPQDHGANLRVRQDGARPPLCTPRHRFRAAQPKPPQPLRRGAEGCRRGGAGCPCRPRSRCALRARSRRRAPQVVTGAKTEAMAKLAARKYARIIQKLQFPAQFKVRGALALPLPRRGALTAALPVTGLHNPKHCGLLRRPLPHPAGRPVLRAPAVLQRAFAAFAPAYFD